MLDAHLGTIGIWLALVASIAGVVVIAYGLFTGRHAVAVGSRRAVLFPVTAGCWRPSCWPVRSWPRWPWSTR